MTRCKPDVVSVKFKNPDPGVQRVVQILERGERTVPYWWFINRFPQRYRNARFAYKYVAWAMSALAAVFVASDLVDQDSGVGTVADRCFADVPPVGHR
jgi:hypothetical protein